MDLSLAEIEILRAIDKCGNDEGEYTSFERMIASIRDPELSRDDTGISDALARLEAKTFIKTMGGRAVKLTEGGIVALRAL